MDNIYTRPMDKSTLEDTRLINTLLAKELKHLVETGTRINQIRDIFYNVKDEPEIHEARRIWFKRFYDKSVKAGKREEDRFKGNDKEWSKYAAEVKAADFLGWVADKVDPLIYKKLGLTGKGEVVRGTVPVLYILEKRHWQSIQCMDSFGASYVFLEGTPTNSQTNGIEAVLSNEWVGFGTFTVIHVTDYDQAGLNAFEALKTQLHKFAPTLAFRVHWVWDGVSTRSNTFKQFSQYTLTDNTFNAEWIEQRGNKGIEFNPVRNVDAMANLLYQVSNKVIPSITYAVNVYDAWFRDEYRKRANEDVELQNIKANVARLDEQVRNLEEKHEDAVTKLNPIFIESKNAFGGRCIVPSKSSVLFHDAFKRLKTKLETIFQHHKNPYSDSYGDSHNRRVQRERERCHGTPTSLSWREEQKLVQWDEIFEG